MILYAKIRAPQLCSREVRIDLLYIRHDWEEIAKSVANQRFTPPYFI